MKGFPLEQGLVAPRAGIGGPETRHTKDKTKQKSVLSEMGECTAFLVS